MRVLLLAIFVSISVIVFDVPCYCGEEFAPDVKNALEKATKWVAKSQEADGSWGGRYKKEYSAGATALALLALVKGGYETDSSVVKQGYQSLIAQSLKKTYSVSVAVLAVLALYEPTKADMRKAKKKFGKLLIENIKKAPAVHRDYLKKAVQWLISKQQPGGGWRYPMQAAKESGAGQDISNTQFALLALASAQRAGFSVSHSVFVKAARYALSTQQKTGPKVKTFKVPVADFGFRKLKKLEEDPETATDLFKNRKKSDDPYERFGKKLPQFCRARGFYYRTVNELEGGEQSIYFNTTGSMTTAGLTALICCKVALESQKKLPPNLAKELSTGIRDGAGWILHKFTVLENPQGDANWYHYYLYGLERVGILGCIDKFGDWDWYYSGKQHLLREQKSPGCWLGGYRGNLPAAVRPEGDEDIDHIDTCFAILFLARGTMPLIGAPRPPADMQPFTGEDFSKEKSEKGEEPKTEEEEKETNK